MIVPSIDIMDGRAVQLVGGDPARLEIDGGDPLEVAKRFSVVGPIAVIDLDAALGRGDNTDVIRELCARYECRVGGGIRTVDKAIEWLNAGARHVILGSAARPDVLSELPRERTMAAVDARDGRVVIDGWQSETGVGALERIAELRDLVDGFLVTSVEREGRMAGPDLAFARATIEAAGGKRVTFAGGVTTAEDVAELNRGGADAQVGMALYSGRLGLGEAFAACLDRFDADGLMPTVVCDASGTALGLVYSSRESIAMAINERAGVYYSRSRGEIWRKGATSGDRQTLVKLQADCDGDALRAMVQQVGGGFCHLQTQTCWGEDSGVSDLARTVADRVKSAPKGSYTARLLGDPALMRSKLLEEAGELLDAADPAHAEAEAADVLYFALAALAQRGGTWQGVERELDRRRLRVTRRPGNAKPDRATLNAGES